MKTIVLNQRKERDELLSRQYLTRRSSMEEERIIEKDGYTITVVSVSKL